MEQKPEACAPSACPDLAELTRAVQGLMRAFPNDDADGHRLYHEEVIATQRARKEFWQKLTFELVKWGVVGFAGWAAVQLWSGFLKGKAGL